MMDASSSGRDLKVRDVSPPPPPPAAASSPPQPPLTPSTQVLSPVLSIQSSGESLNLVLILFVSIHSISTSIVECFHFLSIDCFYYISHISLSL